MPSCSTHELLVVIMNSCLVGQMQLVIYGAEGANSSWHAVWNLGLLVQVGALWMGLQICGK